MAQELNKLDRGILDVLIQNAKTPYAKIAAEFKVSNGTIHVRVKKMEKMGVITGATMRVDYQKLGFDIHAYVGITLESGSSYTDVIAELNKITEVTSSHFTTGKFSIFAQLVCRDTTHMRETLNGRILKIKGVQHTESFISLEKGIERAGLVS